MGWDVVFETECRRLASVVCGGGETPAARDAAWRALLARTAPFVEEWAARSPLLRRCGLNEEDEPRAVLVTVIARLCRRDFANLRAFLRRGPDQPSPAPRDEVDDEARADDEEVALVEALLRLTRADGEAAPPEEPAAAEAPTELRFRGWLQRLVRFAVKDHIKHRLGWGSSARAHGVLVAMARPRGADDVERSLRELGSAVVEVVLERAADDALVLTLEYLPGSLRLEAVTRRLEQLGYRATWSPSSSKRALGTDAERLGELPERGERPPVTDLLTMRRVLENVHGHMATFPAPMRRALQLWSEDVGFDEIAAQLQLAGAAEARALVKAGQARLRERFRETGS